MLNGMGGVPAAQTVDWVPGISHYNEGMMNSDQGVDKVRCVDLCWPRCHMVKFLAKSFSTSTTMALGDLGSRIDIIGLLF